MAGPQQAPGSYGPGPLDQFFGPPGQQPTQRVAPAEGTSTASGGNKGLTLALQLLGLAAVALLAGSLWVACSPTGGHKSASTASTSSAAPASGAPQAPGFQQVAQQRDTDCAANSYGQVPGYFTQHPCVGLTRWIYTTTDPNGDKVVTTLAKVQMSDAASAAGLKALTDSDGTGSMGYLMHPGLAVPQAPNHLGHDAGYIAALQDTTVVIAESAFLDSPRSDVPGLKKISAQAIATEGK